MDGRARALNANGCWWCCGGDEERNDGGDDEAADGSPGWPTPTPASRVGGGGDEDVTC